MRAARAISEYGTPSRSAMMNAAAPITGVIREGLGSATARRKAGPEEQHEPDQDADDPERVVHQHGEHDPDDDEKQW